MIINFVFEIPPGTINKTKLDEVQIPDGVITKAHINIPSGWNYTAGIRVETGGSITLPTAGSEYISGNNLDVTLEPLVFVKRGILSIYGVNKDPVNPHSGVVILELIPIDEIGG